MTNVDRGETALRRYRTLSAVLAAGVKLVLSLGRLDCAQVSELLNLRELRKVMWKTWMEPERLTWARDGRHRVRDRPRVERKTTCEVRLAAEPFSSPDPWSGLAALKKPRRFAAGEFLFRENEPCLGVYLVKQGHVRLLMEAQPGHYRLFETVGPGTCLGLNEVMGGMWHKFTAEAAEAVEADCIERMTLLKFLRKHHDVCMQIVGLLSEDLHGLYRRFRELAQTGTRGKRKPVSDRVH